MAHAIVVAALGGLLVGSFLNVVAYRLPRGESLVTPGSRCPSCGHPVRPYDNVPVLSWLALRGRCRDCDEPISGRYAIVEATTAALFVAVVAVRYGETSQLVLGLVLVALLLPLALIDLDTRLLPNALTLPAAGLAVALGIGLDPGGQVERLVAGAAAGGFFLVAALLQPRGMGIGDVKLAAVLGLFLGREVAVAVLVALVCGVAVGVAIIARKGAAEGRKTAIPFGPFLALGGVVAVLAGDVLVDAYHSTL
ncbi:MAG: leader peptidase (prepilin peptidase) / N-methyltransferase [Solirubrobacteraceae bacterium]|nr:leader peptidase (prepilin peptidase) / N-methyltransferase [Solirubrobacteraceae bacterium]